MGKQKKQKAPFDMLQPIRQHAALMNAMDNQEENQIPKSRIALFFLVIFALGGGLVYVRRQMYEASWGGKTVSQWMHSLLYDGNSTMATMAFKGMGSNAVLTLIGMLNADGSKWLDKSVWLGRLRGLMAQQCRYSAAWACGEIGPAAQPAIPALTRMFERRDYGWTDAAIALRRISPEGVRILTNALPSSEEEVRFGLVYILRYETNNVGAAASALNRALHDRAPRVRAEAAWGLGVLHEDAQTSVRGLAECLRDSEPRVQESAIQALGLFGKDAAPAVPGLLEFSQTNTISMGSTAWHALQKIDPEAAAVAAIRFQSGRK
jgi:hypothetical protein